MDALLAYGKLDGEWQGVLKQFLSTLYDKGVVKQGSADSQGYATLSCSQIRQLKAYSEEYLEEVYKIHAPHSPTRPPTAMREDPSGCGGRALARAS